VPAPAEAQRKGFETAVRLSPRTVAEFLSTEIDQLQDARARICPSCGWVSKRKSRTTAVVKALGIVAAYVVIVAGLTAAMGTDTAQENSFILTIGLIMFLGIAWRTLSEGWAGDECAHCHEATLMPLSADERAQLTTQAERQLEAQTQKVQP
jgi:cytochrome c553